MNLRPTGIAGLTIIDLDPREDERGFFARAFDADVFAAAGLESVVLQGNVSFNHVAGTLRGMHFQVDPEPEAKLVRCTRGAVVDIVVDVHPGSPTFGHHEAVELTADNRRALYVPPYFAHGYQTLVDATEVTYQVSGRYTPGAERGLRFDDPDLALPWPREVTLISAKDRQWPTLAEAVAAGLAGPARSGPARSGPARSGPARSGGPGLHGERPSVEGGLR